MRSQSSGPDATSRIRAQSATVVVITPGQERSLNPSILGMRPRLGFRPTVPVYPAGERVEPPASPAVQNGTRPPATAAADPPLLPPGVRLRFQGLRVVPCASVCVTPSMPNSAVVTLPSGMAPAPRSRAMNTESRCSGGSSL